MGINLLTASPAVNAVAPIARAASLDVHGAFPDDEVDDVDLRELLHRQP